MHCLIQSVVFIIFPEYPRHVLRKYDQRLGKSRDAIQVIIDLSWAKIKSQQEMIPSRVNAILNKCHDTPEYNNIILGILAP